MLAGIAEVRFFPKKEIKIVNMEELLAKSKPTPRLSVKQKEMPTRSLTEKKGYGILEKAATVALMGALVVGLWLNVKES